MKQADIIKRNNVRVIGNGEEPMVFAHGFGCDQNMWRFLVPSFTDEYKVVLFDYVGSGKSDLSAFDPARYSDLRGYAQDVLEVCDALELKDVVFVGHSVSGMIGILAALKKPEIFSNLVLIAPSPCFINDPPEYHGGFERQDIEELLALMDKNYLGWANYLAGAVMANPDRPELSQELETSICSTDPKTAKRFAEATFLSDNRKILAQLNVPSFVMQCSDDIIAPLSVGEYLKERIPGTRLRVMKATGHCPHVSHPEETRDFIKEYLAQPVSA
jgi:sigma-B regulation protein RsbQ